MSLPNIVIIGNTTGPGELRFTPNGKAVFNFTVVANKRQKNRDTGEWEDGGRSPFIRVALWGDDAEAAAEVLSTQASYKVIVTGQLLAREYEKDGQKRESIELDYATVGVVPARVTEGKPRQTKQAPPAQADPWAAPPAADPWATPEPAF